MGYGFGLVGPSAVRRRYPVSFDTVYPPPPHTHAYVSSGTGARQKEVDTYHGVSPTQWGRCVISRPIVRVGAPTFFRFCYLFCLGVGQLSSPSWCVHDAAQQFRVFEQAAWLKHR